MTGTFFSPSAIEILVYFFIWVFGLKKKRSVLLLQNTLSNEIPENIQLFCTLILTI